MKKLILSLLLLTAVLGCQNENNGSNISLSSNVKSSEDNQAKMLKEKQEQRIKDSLKLIEKETLEIESYTGDYHIPPPSGPGTGVCSETLTIKDRRLIGTETCGGHDENGHTESHDELFNVDFRANKVYKLSGLFDTKDGHAFGCDYFEFKNNKLYLYDEKMKIINEDFCGFFAKKCDCIISRTN